MLSALTPRDLRGMVPPQPMEIILHEVDEGGRPQLAYILPHFPGPLLPLLQQRGVTVSSEMLPDMSGVVLMLQLP